MPFFRGSHLASLSRTDFFCCGSPDRDGPATSLLLILEQHYMLTLVVDATSVCRTFRYFRWVPFYKHDTLLHCHSDFLESGTTPRCIKFPKIRYFQQSWILTNVRTSLTMPWAPDPSQGNEALAITEPQDRFSQRHSDRSPQTHRSRAW